MPTLSTQDKLPESEALARELDALDVALAELKARYEQYFVGVDRKPPTRLREEVRERLGKIRGAFVRSASLKFRVQALQQRLLTYERLWTRTLSEMEAGTYARDVFKARRRRQGERASPPGGPSPAVAAPPPATANPTAALSDRRLQEVFAEYLQAKKACGEDVSRLSFESVAASLRAQVPALLTKHGVRDADFKISVRDGKTILRVVPKR